jgi:NAD(P)H-hydrate epimerase
MKICTPSQMQEIDRKAIDGLGIPGLELMENAGRSVYEMILDYYGPADGNRVTVVAGKGNNGGDGFVVARYLKEDGAHVEIFLIGSKDQVTGDAEINLKKALELGIPLHEITDPDNFYIPDDSWVIVDAIFGTGFTGTIRAPYDQIILKINQSDIPIVAVDAPSGLDGATGKVSEPCVRADLTVTFGLPKIGQVMYPGKSYCGFLEVADIGFPSGLDDDIHTYLTTDEEAVKLLPRRKPDAHKGDFGKLFVLAGSTGLTGAAVMTSMAAYRCGTGLVVLGCPSSLNPIFEMKMTEVMTRPLPDVAKKGHLALRGLGEIRQQIEWADAIAIGPGLGTHHETAELIQRLCKEIARPMVVDADGLNNLAKDLSCLKAHKRPLVITPHPGEFARLTGRSIDEITDDRIRFASEFAREYSLCVVLKGAPTIVARRSGNVYINYSGNEGMATGGSGDVLTGLIGGFLAQGVCYSDAAVLATYVHGAAGDIAAEMYGSRGMIAGDILEFVPQALMELEDYRDEEIIN